MKIILESTTKLVHLNGVQCRIWEGQTESGIRVHAFLPRIAIDENETEENIQLFQKELQECRKPSPELNVYPLRMII